MLQMGGDFGFENANAWFKNLDLLMKAVNLEGRVNVRVLPVKRARWNLLGTKITRQSARAPLFESRL